MAERHWIYERGTDEEIALHESQRISFGASQFDYYDFCSYIAKIFIEYHKYCTGENGMRPGGVRSYPGYLDNEEQWLAILAEIRTKFEVFLDPDADWAEQHASANEAMELAKEYFSDFWD